VATAPRQPESADEAVRELMLLMPRLVSRAKRLPIPAQLQALSLSPRHLSLLSYLLFDGPMIVSQLAARLRVAPTTASLLVSELSAKGVLVRSEDPNDRRRRVIDISADSRPAIRQWLAPGAAAWQRALAPLSQAERITFIDTLRAYESAVTTRG
jgi:DNA-binding MarR family transcriptional regulator